MLSAPFSPSLSSFLHIYNANASMLDVVPEASETVLISFYSFFFLFVWLQLFPLQYILASLSCSSVSSTVDSVYCIFCFSCWIIDLSLVPLSICSLLKVSNFSLCSSILLPCSLNIFMIITLNSLSDKLLISTSLTSFSEVVFSFYLEHILLSPHLAWFSVLSLCVR